MLFKAILRVFKTLFSNQQMLIISLTIRVFPFITPKISVVLLDYVASF